MNFIILTDYYHPIVKSGSIIIGDLATELFQQGHKVTIVTFVENQNKAFQIVSEDGIQIIRIRSVTRDKKYGRIGRLWAELYSNKIIKFKFKILIVRQSFVFTIYFLRSY